MSIMVLDNNNRIADVDSDLLANLIYSRSIKRFLRSDGWISIASGPLRGSGGRYAGPDRRAGAVAGFINLDSDKLDKDALGKELRNEPYSREAENVEETPGVTNANQGLKTLAGELDREKDKLKSLVDSIADEVWFFDAESDLLHLNPAALAALGLENAVSCTLRSVLNGIELREPDGAQRSPDKAPLLRSLRGETVVGEEILCDKKTGEKRYRRYHTAPVKDKSGTVIGAVAVVSDITKEKLAARALENTLADRELLMMQLRKTEKKFKAQNKKLHEDLIIAQSAQKEIIRMGIHECPRLVVDYRYVPKDRVSGDYIALYGPDDDGLGFFIGDVSGHGIAAALFVSLVKSVTDRIYRKTGREPAAFLKRLNGELVNSMGSYFVTGIYGRVSPCSSGGPVAFRYSNGGHPNPVLVRADGKVFQSGRSNIVMGVADTVEYQEQEFALERGDRVFFFTDGIPEAMNGKREQIGFEKGLETIFKKTRRDALSDTLDAILDEVSRFRGMKAPNDDITIVGFEAR